MIPYGKQTIDQDDIDAVVDILKSDFLTTGPKIDEFEEKFAEYCGAKYAVAVCNGTAALHLANLAVGINTMNASVITTPITFLATPASVLYAGGDPIFADICEGTFTIDPSQIKKILKNSNKPVKGIMPVHLGGVVCDMDSIYEIAKENDLWIIEDACHALGGEWVDKRGEQHRVGDCSHSVMTTFSFHPVKQITTGEGGAITTNNKEIYDRLQILRSHGMVKEEKNLIENHGGWYYELHELGYNFRMTDIQAALGIEQLKKSDEWVKLRRELVSRYDIAFDGIDAIIPQKHSDIDSHSSYHLYIMQCEKRDELYKYLKENGIMSQVHYIPIHLQPFYKKEFGYREGDFTVAENYYKKALSLPLYPKLKFSDQEKIISIIKSFYAKS